MIVDLRPAMIVALVVVVALVAWRRAIAAPPRWLPLTVGLLQAGIVAGVAFTYFGLRAVHRSLEDVNPGEKASQLARGISNSMWGIVAAAACALAAMIVLGIATYRSRNVGRDDLPAATTRQP